MTKEHCILKAKILQEEGKTQREIAEALGVTDRAVRAARRILVRSFDSQ
ncbi:MAG: hypothetical protein GX430_01895 [Treponema sp.]|nr:hypothetical protein [Treponema sp.]